MARPPRVSSVEIAIAVPPPPRSRRGSRRTLHAVTISSCRLRSISLKTSLEAPRRRLNRLPGQRQWTKLQKSFLSASCPQPSLGTVGEESHPEDDCAAGLTHTEIGVAAPGTVSDEDDDDEDDALEAVGEGVLPWNRGRAAVVHGRTRVRLREGPQATQQLVHRRTRRRATTRAAETPTLRVAPAPAKGQEHRRAGGPGRGTWEKKKKKGRRVFRRNRQTSGVRALAPPWGPGRVAPARAVMPTRQPRVGAKEDTS